MGQSPNKNIKRLRRKDITKILDTIKERFDVDFPSDYLFYETAKCKIYIISPEFQNFDFENMRIDKGGFYFCERKGDFLRLSMQAAQKIGQIAKSAKIEPKNSLKLTEPDYLTYMKGEEIKTDHPNNSSILLIFQDEVFCWAQVKDGYIINYVPKAYRGTIII